MISLGYAKAEAEEAVRKASGSIDVTEGVEVLIKEALSCV